MSNMKRYFRGRGPSENQKRHELRETLEKTLLVLDKIDVAEVEDRVYKAQDMLDEIDSLMIKSKGNPQTKKNPPVDEDKKHTYDSIKDALRVLHQKQRTTTKNSPRPPPMSSRTDPSIKTTGVFGRDEDKKAIIQLLLSKNAIPSQIDIIAIVGIGGIGKTTLANLAYNDYAVEAHFDLCLWLTLSENFDYSNLTNAILQKISPNAAQPEIPTTTDKVRHVSFANDKIHDLNKFYGVILDAKSLRTILQFTSMHKHKKIHLSKEQLHGMFSKLLSLRVLCLSHFDISTLPDSIGKLMHLRYLDLSHTPMKELSASIGELSNLEILLLSHCSRLGELPIEFVMLLNLCYLDITKTPLKKLPPNMSRLKNLHTLTNFVVLENGGSGIEELGPLVFLRTLCISALQNVSRDASKAKLGNKSDLDDLVLKWSDDDNSEQKFECPNLKDLEEEYSLEGFESFDSFFKKLKVSDISELINLPPGLHSLKIEGCDALDILTEELFSSNPDLQDLKIVDCHHLKLFLRNCTFTTLRKLYIYNCRKLEYISPLDMVEYLTIGSSCDSLESISLASFPNLKTLSIWDCANLVSILVPQGPVMSLEVLEIRDCPKLNSFLTGGLCALNVTSIVLSRCDNLKHFPKELDKFISLELLSINECPELESFPEGGLPPNLSLLSITSCNKLTLEKKWGLHRLERLGSFEIEGGCTKMESFPEKNLLPNKLNFLRISKLRNLKFLNADELRYLSSLETLEINACDKLMSLPEDALPSSLSSLCISECPMLKSMDWFNIAHIPHIQIDGEVFP
ncbi:hypothetical protein ACFE04_006353 [Oxalis oulophora]